jgi:CHRD domain
MHRPELAGAILAIAVTTISASYANAQTFHADLSGFDELSPNAVFTPGQGTLTLKLDQKLQLVTYTLTYSGLSSNVTQAHIHFGKERDIGGIFVFLCGTAANPGPTGTPLCPLTGGTVTGQLTPASVVAFAPSDIKAGDFSIVPAALLSDTAYANVHTVNHPGGEIRGQVGQAGPNQ